MFARLRRRTKSTRRAKFVSQFRPQMETLEARQLLAVVTVDNSQILGTVSPDLTGTNVLHAYERDADWQDGQIAAQLKAIGTGFIRYPGGGVTAQYHWNDPHGIGWQDIWNPNAEYEAVPGREWMNLDEYMDQIRLSGAKALVGVNVSSGHFYNRVQDGVEEAVALVRYIKQKGYNVDHYFLDNELQFRMSPQQYSDYINLYATAMRQVDPSLKIVANWQNFWDNGWGYILDNAGKNIDYIDFHAYWNWENATFDEWRGDQAMVFRGQTLTQIIERFQTEIANRKLDVKVGMFEWNLGAVATHTERPGAFQAGLMNSEMLMQAVEADIDAATFWPLHWTANTEGDDFARRALLTGDELSESALYKIFEMYSSSLGDKRVASTSSGADIRTIASFNPANQTSTIYLLQKTGSDTFVQLDLGSFLSSPGNFEVQARTYQATGGVLDGDRAQVVSIPANLTSSGMVTLNVPAYTFTRVTISPRAASSASSSSNSSSTGATTTSSSNTSSGQAATPTASAPATIGPSQQQELLNAQSAALADEGAAPNVGGQFLVTDLNSEVVVAGSHPSRFEQVGDLTFFSAATSAIGDELWRTDGTVAGTFRLKDIKPGVIKSGLLSRAFFSSSPRDLINVNGTLFFTANDGVHNVELWKSDGTREGTVLVSDVRSGPKSSYLSTLVNVGDKLYFRATNGNDGYELWSSDGTAAGTMQVADLAPGAQSSYPTHLTDVDGTLYFTATDGNSGEELWKITPTGPVRVADINAGAASSRPTELAAIGNTLYFRATDGVSGYELWKTDGTAAGTVQVSDIHAGAGSSSPKAITDVSGTIYFRANDGQSGYELWKSDGTDAGTVRVADILPGIRGSYPRDFVNVNGSLFFQADDGATGFEMWRTQGSSVVRLADITPGTANGVITGMAEVGGTLYFRSADALKRTTLWKTDGTVDGTVQVPGVAGGPAARNPRDLINANGRLYLSAIDVDGNVELWRNNGIGAERFIDIWVSTSAGNPASLENVSGTLFFAASDRVTGTELWKSNGTKGGTVRVKDINAAGKASNPNNLTNVNGTLFFAATDGVNGIELWKSNGTATGTVLVKNISAGLVGSYPSNLTNVNGKLYFTARDSTGGFELWKSDGTTAGTIRLKDLRVGSIGSYPSSLTNVNGTLFFQANNGAYGKELWKTNGTAAGTVVVRDIANGFMGSAPDQLVNVNGTLYFQANDGNSGVELWKSDGTTAGTQLVEDIAAGPTGSAPQLLTNVSGKLFFKASDGVNGPGLWKSNGTPEGTELVKAIKVGAALGTEPGHLTNMNGTVYFRAKTSTSGYELWKSDGTTVGTEQVKDIRAGEVGSYITNLTNVNGKLYFSGNDGTADVLWTSDGTEAGTVPVPVLTAGKPFLPADITGVGNKMFYTASSDTFGQELWSLNLPKSLRISNLSVKENLAAGSIVGRLSTTNSNPGDHFTYTITEGNVGNAFRISGSNLVTNVALDFESRKQYTLRIRSTDANGFSHGREFTINVLNGNDAPFLNNALNLSIGSIMEDVKTPAGTLIKFFTSDAISDIDPNSPKGIAITSAETANGSWQYSLGDGKWFPLGKPTETSARLLAINDLTRVRFIPNADFTGRARLFYRAWDRSDNAAPGTTASTVGKRGGGGSFSASYDSAFIVVKPTPDLPRIVIGGTIGYVHDEPAIVLAAAAIVADVDRVGFATGQLRVRITDGASGTNRLLLGVGFSINANNDVFQGGVRIGRCAMNGAGTKDLLITFNSNAKPAIVQELVRTLTFKTVNGAAGTRRLVFTISDSTGRISGEATKAVVVT